MAHVCYDEGTCNVTTDARRAPCPKCGNVPDVERLVLRWDDMPAMYHVCCHRCDKFGATAPTVGGAIAKWERSITEGGWQWR